MRLKYGNGPRAARGDRGDLQLGRLGGAFRFHGQLDVAEVSENTTAATSVMHGDRRLALSVWSALNAMQEGKGM